MESATPPDFETFAVNPEEPQKVFQYRPQRRFPLGPPNPAKVARLRQQIHKTQDMQPIYRMDDSISWRVQSRTIPNPFEGFTAADSSPSRSIVNLNDASVSWQFIRSDEFSTFLRPCLTTWIWLPNANIAHNRQNCLSECKIRAVPSVRGRKMPLRLIRLLKAKLLIFASGQQVVDRNHL
jgi:hypothetical protein